MTTQNLWDAAKAVLREVYSSTILPQETRIDNLTLHLKQQEKEEEEEKKTVQEEETNHKDPSRNKWKINERNISDN